MNKADIVSFVSDKTGLSKAAASDALDAVVIKLSHAGGLTKAREMARLASGLGLRMRIEDTVGAEIVRAAVGHLAVTVPAKSLLAAYPHTATVSLAKTSTRFEDGKLVCGDEPRQSGPNDDRIGIHCHSPLPVVRF